MQTMKVVRSAIPQLAPAPTSTKMRLFLAPLALPLLALMAKQALLQQVVKRVATVLAERRVVTVLMLLAMQAIPKVKTARQPQMAKMVQADKLEKRVPTELLASMGARVQLVQRVRMGALVLPHTCTTPQFRQHFLTPRQVW